MGFNGANGSDKVVEATWAPYRAFVEGTVAAQEPYMRLAAGLLASQAEVGRFAARVLVEQAEQQREAYRLLVKESSRAYKVSPRVPASGGRGSPASRETELPIEGYDRLGVEEVDRQLVGLNAREVVQLRSYERRHKNRLAMLERLDRSLV